MIALWLLAVAPALARPEHWELIGITNSGVRILVDTRSIRVSTALRKATIRLGSPRSLAGKIVETRNLKSSTAPRCRGSYYVHI